MKRHISAIFVLFFYLLTITCYADAVTRRIPILSNDKVSVWKTQVYPAKNQVLKPHRHDNDRVLVALTDGVLKVTNDKGRSHELRLEKDMAYYLPHDVKGELHSDENISGHPIWVIVIELKRS